MAILRRPVGHSRISMHRPGVYALNIRQDFMSKQIVVNIFERALLGTIGSAPQEREPKRIDRHRDGLSVAIGPVCFRVPTRAESWRTLVILSHLRRSGSDRECRVQ